MPSKVTKLTYFGLYGRVSAVKFQLKHGGCNFETRDVSSEEWGGMKAQYGSMPIAQLDDGTEIQETMPISRMIAIELGQYPEDPLQGYENDRLMNIYYDLFNAMSGPQLSGDKKRITETAKAKLIPFLDSIEARLGKSKWLVGDKICMVDFWVGAMYTDKLTNEMGHMDCFKFALDSHPNFVRYGEDFKKENAAWLAERPKLAM